MKKIIKALFVPIFSFLAPILLSSCSSDENFYFANFESYMSQDLQNDLLSGNLKGFKGNKIQNFNYRTFSTNEDLERNFLVNYDVAVPSTYLAAKLANEGDLLPIDWNQFNLYKLDKNGMQTKDKITNASDALTLFTPQVRAILLAYDLSEAFEKDENKVDVNGGLLNYCVPYFLQKFGFAYKTDDGKEWPSLSSDLDYSWKNIMDAIKENKVKKISATDDARILYSIARLIETDGQNVNPGETIKPNQYSTTYENLVSKEDYIKTYLNLSEGLPKDKYYLNSDSNNVLNSFAPINGSDAIFSYNGDILFGTQGGDDAAYDENDCHAFEKWISNYINDENEFLIKNSKPNNSFLLLDTMVINKNRVDTQQKLDLAYSVLYKIGLEGSDLSLYSDQTKTKYNNDTIFKVDQDDNFINGPMQNFNYVQYTSPLLTLNAYVLNSSSDVNKYQNGFGEIFSSLSSLVNKQGYFTDLYKQEVVVKSENNPQGFLTEQQYWNYIETLISIYEITNEANANNTPRNISDLNKSNMSWAYLDVKSKYF